ncbi:MAG: 5-formyltetrahydrofolate cyclo-ligase [Clostridia bacterium]|nr:5-formyltetrahydrofolate cyclo-ligase [Clostridia bacterium]
MNKVNVKELKNEIRNTYKEKRKSISPEDRKTMDSAIAKKLLSLSSYRFADTILLYSPLKYEINTLEIATDALLKGKKVAYPRCIEDNQMVYHYISSLNDLIPGMYGIKEPSKDLPIFSPTDTEHVICVLPAIVYDKRGYRIGYGKGYYDRFLSGFKGAKAGLIYSEYILDSIPYGKFDLQSDFVITEKGVISFAKN